MKPIQPLMNMEVTEKQARFFLLLAKAGAWDIRNGSIEIYVDPNGNPTKASTSQFVTLSPMAVDPSLDIRITV